MRTIADAYKIALGLLFIFACFGIAGTSDYHDAIKIEELTAQSARDARAYWLKDAGREAEEMRQLGFDVMFAELSEKAEKMRTKK